MVIYRLDCLIDRLPIVNKYGNGWKIIKNSLDSVSLTSHKLEEGGAKIDL